MPFTLHSFSIEGNCIAARGSVVLGKTISHYKILEKIGEGVFDEFPEKVAADLAFVSSTGTHGTFKHPRKTALDLYDQTAEIYCTCDEALTQLDLVVTVSDAGQTTVSPQQQPSYFVWERGADGTLRKVVVQ